MSNDDSEDMIELDGVEFPARAPRADCVAAVNAARKYIHNHDGGTKDEILHELAPEDNHPIGPTGAVARAKGLSPRFREWWWREIVKPGLRVLSDVEAADEEERTWYPIDVNDT